MKKFFFDTADAEYIKNTYKKMWGDVNSKDVIGVTTNPSAFGKVGIKTVEEALERVKRLCDVVDKIKNNDEDKGVVYIQAPNSKMSVVDILKWYDLFKDAARSFNTRICLKIPPYYEILSQISKFPNDVDLNVTGVADCSTAAMCANYQPRYISVIVGRMEEKAINAMEQINYINHFIKESETEIITGAMRTVNGVKWAIEMGTVPTIGTKVMDLILDEVGVKGFVEMWNNEIELYDMKASPVITEEMTNLSYAFFNQMDELGKDLYEDFNLNYKDTGLCNTQTAFMNFRK